MTGAGSPASKSTASSTSSGTISANTSKLNFGNVLAGSSSVQRLTLTNTGKVTVKISHAAIAGSEFSLIEPIVPVSIAPGQKHSFEVRFGPRVSGAVFGDVIVVSDATNSHFGVSLVGTGTTGLSISGQPESETVTAGRPATFSVVAAGAGTLTYQWKKNGEAISGATASIYAIPAVTSSESGAQFAVIVSDSDGSVTSNAATLTVTAVDVAPSIASQPASASVIAGQRAAFSVTATGTGPLSYQWNNGGVAISGATSSSYAIPAATTGENGAQFTVTVANTAGKVTSMPARLTVNAASSALDASQYALNFPNANVGSRSVLPVILRNDGNTQVTISNVTISGAGYAATGVASGEMLAPGQSATLSVTFDPAGAGLIPGSIVVTSNAANSPANITMSGTGIQAAASHSATLNWAASTSTVSGYNVYRSAVSGGPYAKLDSAPVSATVSTDNAVEAGHTYYYVVTSIDSSGAESAYSTEVSATIP